jgi:hypothetical protein
MEDNLQARYPAAVEARLLWDAADGLVRPEPGLRFCAAAHRWVAAGGSALAPDGADVDVATAVRRLVGEYGARRLPVGVIGPNDASALELETAEAIGRGVAGLGLPLICGGRGGCMEAAARGAAGAGGLVIGMLPSADWLSANEHVHVPIATGLGEARNAIIASACFALVAVGEGHGTLSEMALGLKMRRLVIAMPQAERVRGATPCDTAQDAMAHVARRYLGLDGEAVR